MLILNWLLELYPIRLASFGENTTSILLAFRRGTQIHPQWIAAQGPGRKFMCAFSGRVQMHEVIENACGILAIAIVLIAFSALQSKSMVGKYIKVPSEVHSARYWTPG